MAESGGSLGTIIYPLVRFREPTTRAVGPYNIPGSILRHYRVDGIGLHLSESGYVVIETTDTRKGVDIVNCISLALSLLGNHRFYPSGENELSVIEYSSSGAGSLRIVEGRLSSARDILVFQGRIDTGLASIAHGYNPKFMDVFVRLATDMYRSKHRERILLFFDAWHAIVRKDMMMGFMLSWICFEMWLNEELRMHLQRMGISGKGQYEILKMNVRMKIKFLKAELDSGTLSQIGDYHIPNVDDLGIADDLREYRNKVVHSGHRPTRVRVEQCKKLANKSMWRYFRLSGIKYQDYLDEADVVLSRKKRHEPLAY